jgi:hypothetical protein
MVESGQQDPGARADPGVRFALIEIEIVRARRKLAALRHEGERHFIDDQPVHPEVPGVLHDIVDRGDELSRVRSTGPGTTAVNKAFSRAELDEQHRHLDDLEARIARLAELTGDDPHKHERHFVDG